jgi:hypothetical protein
MLVKRFSVALAVMAMCLISAVAQATIIAGWDNEHYSKPAEVDLFGVAPTDFPYLKDFGASALANETINPVDASLNSNLDYVSVDSFGGTTLNDLGPAGANPGGSLSFIGTQSNGSSIVWSVPTTGFKSINVSWAQRGTATGFQSRKFEYSTNGGVSYTDFGAFSGSAGALSATYALVSLDLSGVAALNSNPLVKFRLTYDGATGSTGNNRIDNFYVQGTAVPEPASLALLGLGAIGCVGLIRRKK